MAKATKQPVKSTLRPRWRVARGREVALGPGKAELLARVGETGSIVEAAKQMDMSYMRAWTLIKTMNACFKEPLVTTARGGRKGGGAQLTTTGREVVELYRQMDEAGLRAVRVPWKKLSGLLK